MNDDKDTPPCPICGMDINWSGYGEIVCPTCGSKYVWDECHQIQLDDEMVAAIRKILEGRLTQRITRAWDFGDIDPIHCEVTVDSGADVAFVADRICIRSTKSCRVECRVGAQEPKGFEATHPTGHDIVAYPEILVGRRIPQCGEAGAFIVVSPIATD